MTPEEINAIITPFLTWLATGKFDLTANLGTAPLIGQTAEATLGGSLVQTQWEAAMKVWSNVGASPGWFDNAGWSIAKGLDSVIGPILPDAAKAMLHHAATGPTPWQSLGEVFTKGFMKDTATWLDARMGQGHVTDEGSFTRATEAYAKCVLLGMVAHAVSGVLKGTLFTVGGVDFTGAARLIGEAAGFDPLIKAFMGNFYNAWLDIPMNRDMLRRFTPSVPRSGDLQRLRGKRILPDKAEFFKYMAGEGYDPFWCEKIEKDLYAEPAIRQLQVMVEAEGVPEGWMEEKLKSLQYDDVDVAFLLDGLHRRQLLPWTNKLVSELLSQRVSGLLTDEELDSLLAARGVKEEARTLALDYCGLRASGQGVEDGLKLLKDQWDRNLLTDQEYADGLDSMGVPAERLDWEWAKAYIGRYHKVYWQTPDEQTRALLGDYRTAYVNGLLSEDEYVAAMTQALLTDEAQTLRLANDRRARDARVLSEFRSYGLPALRDAFVHGFVDSSAYAAALSAAGFPAEYIPDEVALAAALLRRRVEQAVRSDQLPPYTKAYVMGLVDAPLVRAIMQQAGMEAASISTQLTWLTYLREQEKARREAAERKRTAKLLAQEWAALVAWLATYGITEEQLTEVIQAGTEEQTTGTTT